MTNKLVILLNTENGKTPKNIKELVSNQINPLKLIDDEVHDLKKIYKDAFKKKKTEAKELLEHILYEQNKTSPLVFKVTEELNKIEAPVVLINASLLSNNDLEFLGSIYNNAAVLYTSKREDHTEYIWSTTFIDTIEVYEDLKDIKLEINKTISKIYKK